MHTVNQIHTRTMIISQIFQMLESPVQDVKEEELASVYP